MNKGALEENIHKVKSIHQGNILQTIRHMLTVYPQLKLQCNDQSNEATDTSNTDT